MLAGMEECLDISDMQSAATDLLKRYGCPILVTGGGFEGKHLDLLAALDELRLSLSDLVDDRARVPYRKLATTDLFLNAEVLPDPGGFTVRAHLVSAEEGLWLGAEDVYLERGMPDPTPHLRGLAAKAGKYDVGDRLHESASDRSRSDSDGGLAAVSRSWCWRLAVSTHGRRATRTQSSPLSSIWSSVRSNRDSSV
jgi:hypothetical protein